MRHIQLCKLKYGANWINLESNGVIVINLGSMMGFVMAIDWKVVKRGRVCA